MKNIAIIPARGGSKRIPRKNIRLFLGKPIIAYSIEAALKTGLFDDVIVSTDDYEIAEVAIEYGASVPFFRSEKTANDFATIADVLKEVVDNLGLAGRRYDNVCCILATAPLVSSENISKAYDILSVSNCITVYPIVAFSYPILRSLSMDKDGFVKMNWPEYAATRSQDLEPTYHDSGTFYWHKLDRWRTGERNAIGMEIDELYVQDIDTEVDWKMAEIKSQFLKRDEE